MPENARRPTPENPDPAPELEDPTVAEEPDEPGAGRQPVGADNIREGRVRGLMGGSHPQQGQGQGG